MILGAGGLPRRLNFSCMYAGQVPVVPEEGAVLAHLYLVPWWHRALGGVCEVSWLAASIGLAGALLLVVRAALLACVGGPAFLCVCAFGGFLL